MLLGFKECWDLKKGEVSCVGVVRKDLIAEMGVKVLGF